ncbi:MAG: hypothetical protein KAS32_16705 [Candidatus Peribacteraceae bacterium]|nr:hypothetical protein [Candidatus Peribacteraceae bacterium]
MNLKYLTFTGADDTFDPSSMSKLSNLYSFIEWGILVSKKQEDTPRFPSKEWIGKLVAEKESNPSMKLSLHLCGRWLRDLLIGEFTFPHDHLWEACDRVQLNFHREPLTVDKDKFFEQLERFPEKEFIFQIEELNDNLFEEAKARGINAVPLFDTSGGAGIVPEIWPEPYDDVVNGYAGGLGPDNLGPMLTAIESVVKDRLVSVDMETKIRSDDGTILSLYKIEQCIRIVNEWTRNR